MSESDTANGGIKQPDGTPGSESSPHAGATEQMSTGDEHTAVTRSMPGESAPPASNQGEAEPVPSAPEESPQASGGSGGSASDAQATQAAAAGDSSRASGDMGSGPREILTDAGEGAARTGAEVTADGASAVSGTGVPAAAGPGTTAASNSDRTGVPGDSAGVPVPSVHAAAGTSEESVEPNGVRITAITGPGKPDGEVDTRS